MDDNEFYGKFPTVDAALDSYRATPKYQSLRPQDQQAALDQVRKEYRIAFAANRTPSRGSVDGETKPPAVQPDLAGKVRAGAMESTAPVAGEQGMGGHMRGMLHALSGLLPDDNAQAFIDAAMVGSMFTGAGEMGLAARLAVPTLAGAAGGATSGDVASGAEKGFAEGAGGELLIAGGRAAMATGKGAYSWLRRGAKQAMQQTEDLSALSDWLGERFPKTVSTLKDMGDFAKMFRQGGLSRHADGDMETLNSEARDMLGAAKAKNVSSSAPPGAAQGKSPASVFSPKDQDAAQAAALDEAITGQPSTGKAAPSEAPAPPRQDPAQVADAQKRLAKVEASLADAKVKGSGERVINELQARVDELRAKIPTTPEENLARMRSGAIGKTPEERTAYVLEEPGQPPKPMSSGPKYGDLDKKMAAYESKLPPKGAAQSKPSGPFAGAGPTIKVQGIPKKLIDNWNTARNADYLIKWDLATEILDEIEKRGWQLSGHAPLTHAAAAARSGALQMEKYMADQLAKEDSEMASRWLEGRVNQRTARVLTKIFNNDGVIDDAGHFAMNEVQDSAKYHEAWVDLEAAMGKEQAEHFIASAFRGAPPTAIDTPGKAMSATVSGHPGKNMVPGIRFWLHPPKAPHYVGIDDVPYNMGYGRALAAAATLGPDRFLQMMDDMVNAAPREDASGAR